MIYAIQNEILKVEISSLGAELQSILDMRDGVEHLWQGDKNSWARRAPTLFPYCGRLRENQYILNNRSFKSGIHGFARDFEHGMVKRDDNSITFLFSDSEDTMEKYPYHFRLYTIFRLEKEKLTQIFEVVNISDCEMYFSIGYHTGYKLPFDKNHKSEDYSIVFEKEETPVEVVCNEDGLLSGEKRIFFERQNTIPIHDKLFNNDSFVLEDLKSNYVSIVEKDSGRKIRVGIEGFPYTVFWSTPEEVKFVCIEPWYGLPDMHDTDGDFRNKPGIQRLCKGEIFSCRQTIEILK
ncbi:MAG: aldose 1-epimerase family protein [Acetivibrionales bacterium]|jgi:galactose mutarotase-like enzyme